MSDLWLGTAEGHTLHQHTSTESMMMDGAVSGFTGAVASSRFI